MGGSQHQVSDGQVGQEKPVFAHPVWLQGETARLRDRVGRPGLFQLDPVGKGAPRLVPVCHVFTTLNRVLFGYIAAFLSQFKFSLLHQ